MLPAHTTPVVRWTCLLVPFLAMLLHQSAGGAEQVEDWLRAVEQDLSGQTTPELDAAGAVNGKLTGTFEMHTSQEANPWWQVDLGAVTNLSRIIIHCPHTVKRTAGMAVRLSDDGVSWSDLFTATGEQGKIEVLCPAEHARYVRLQARGQTWMHLDEVEVFGDDAAKNLALGQPATQSSVSNWSTASIQPNVDPQQLLTQYDLAYRHIFRMLQQLGPGNAVVRVAEQLKRERVALDDPAWLLLYARASRLRQAMRGTTELATLVDFPALRSAIEDMMASFPGRYPDGQEFLKRLGEHEQRMPATLAAVAKGDERALSELEAVLSLRREALLANPLLDFAQMVVLRRNLGAKARSAMGSELGVGTLNAHTNDSLAKTGWDNELAVVADLRTTPQLKTLYKPEGGKIVKDIDVDFDGRRIMFSSIGDVEENWRVFEIDANTGERDQVIPDDGSDVGHFDSCYLPNSDEIIFCSTASYQGLPCEYGGRRMTCLYRLNRQTGTIRQLTFEQDSDWCPTAMPNGRVMYLRWEYADLPHSNSRILFHMNPDGTGQMEYYGSGSYFMPSFFYARPIPGHPTKTIGVCGGHHGIPRSGRLIIVDPARGRREAQGVVQEIPGFGKEVEPEVRDPMANFYWPQFLHPYPLNEHYFITAMKPDSHALWGIYLVDIYDNMTLLMELEGAALLEPMPLLQRPVPPVISDKIDPESDQATVFLADIYAGDGLKDVPRGEVKRLRVGSYYFSTRGTGGLLGSLGMDGPWDVKRVLGEVPVEEDGSALFTIPANTPIFVQPLDEEGKALQLMRSWFVAMPGETVSCVGCHEDQNTVVMSKSASAALREPSQIVPRRESVRGFYFPHEVQPVLDQYCVGCHDGQSYDGGSPLVDLRGDQYIDDWSSQIAGNCGGGAAGGHFSVSYAELHRYVRRNGIEGDLHMLSPGEFHADTTELVQMLRDARHHNVRLDADAWERLVTWIDLNAPFHGSWSTVGANPRAQVQQLNARRYELARRYANVDVDYEQLDPSPVKILKPVLPQPAPALPPVPSIKGWPFTKQVAQAMQGDQSPLTLELADGVTLECVRIPAGQYVSGNGAVVAIDQPFSLGLFEVTNEQFRCFEPRHDSRREDRHGYQFGRLGYGMNGDEMAAVRLSWSQAIGFCQWLSQKTGKRVSLPSEEQWEWACRAGSDRAFWFGDLGDDFVPYANLGDMRLIEYAANTNSVGYTTTSLIDNPSRYDDWVPRDRQYDDGVFLTNRFPRNELGVMLATPSFDVSRPDGCQGMPQAGRFEANPWGLYDMHGNVWEWTTSETSSGRKIACGGSFYDRPQRCTASSRLDYRPYHKVFNVGFRVAIED